MRERRTGSGADDRNTLRLAFDAVRRVAGEGDYGSTLRAIEDKLREASGAKKLTLSKKKAAAAKK